MILKNSEINTCIKNNYDQPSLNQSICKITKQQDNQRISIRNFDNLKIMYLNARSIINKVQDLQMFIETTNIKYDIIMITETWLEENQEKYFTFTDYECAFASRKNRTGGGVCILIKKHYNYEITKSYCNESIALL